MNFDDIAIVAVLGKGGYGVVTCCKIGSRINELR
jgi:hypothetical protein